MSSSYLTNMTTALLAGFVVVITMALAAPVSAWIAFGIAIALLSIAVIFQLEQERSGVQRSLDFAVALVAVTAIVTSRVYGGVTVTWIEFALALGFVGLAVMGLSFHEVARWRMQHGLSELHGPRRPRLRRHHAERPPLAA
jgi:hypothetical protein